ncbi:MAG: AMP-binding protein, partial [Acidimicrobiia bacterium]
MPADWPLRRTPPDLATRYRAEGWWTDDTLGGTVDASFRAHPDLAVRIWSDTRPARTTIGAVAQQARALAGGLLARGIGPGDVVAFQLPNWLEAAVTFYAVALTGATLVPIVHFYGPHEVGYVLRESQARTLITTDRFGHLDYL